MMTTVMQHIGSLPRSVRGLFPNGRGFRRLCFRSSVLACDKLKRCWSHQPPRHRSTAIEPVHIDHELEPIDCRDYAVCGVSLWLDRRNVHHLLEKHPEFQSKLFSAADFEEYLKPQHDWKTRVINVDEIPQASPRELAKFIQMQTHTMGRHDFIKACHHISDRLPSLNNSEIIELLKMFYPLQFEGNVPLIWSALDEEILRRFDNCKNYEAKKTSDFFLQAVDVMYWLNYLVRSSFAKYYLKYHLESYVRYPSGLQHLLYASAGTVEWKHSFPFQPSIYFLNRIKESCPFDLFLIAIDCFSSLYFGRNRQTTFPKDLYNFLLHKASENISNDDVLITISQMLYVSANQKYDSLLFKSLLSEIAERRHKIPYLVIFYLTFTMANLGIKHEQCFILLECCLKIENFHPRLFCSLLLNLYSNYGPESLQKLSDQIFHEVKRRNFSVISEGHLLRLFMVLLDCGIDAFHLWETTMQGDVLVPNFHDMGGAGNKNILHLAADDCIEVHCHDYQGSRLSEILRIELYKDQCNTATGHQFSSLKSDLNRFSGNLVVTTDILPGFKHKSHRDFILCKNSLNNFCKPSKIHLDKPWHVKKIPSLSSLSYYAVWCSPRNWPSFLVMLKQRALEKLGYISVMDTDLKTWQGALPSSTSSSTSKQS